MKEKKITKFSILGILVGLILVFISGGLATAQQTLPEGGDSFETAVELQPGKYQGGPLNEEVGLEKYYFIQAKAVQEIKIRGVFKVESVYGAINRMILYDENREELVNVSHAHYSSLTLLVSWLPNSSQSIDKYYLKIADKGWGNTQSFTLEVALADCYDAGSQTDAGDSIGKALAVAAPGQYQGYLSGDEWSKKKGTDFKDFYKTAVKKGQVLTVKATPSAEAKLKLGFYNTKRELVKMETAQNAGAIVTYSFNVINDGDIFAAVICEEECSPELVSYSLDFAITAPSEEKPIIGEGKEQPPSEKPGVGVTPPSEEPIEEIEEPYFPYDFETITHRSFFGFSEIWKLVVGYSVFWIIFYVYFALCLQFLAKKTNTPNWWLAWIPIANIFLMLQIAQKPLWWFILVLIPFVNIVIGVIIWMKIAERRGKPSWWGILIIVPFVGLIVPGYLAFFNKEKIEIAPPYTGTGTQEAYKPTVGYKHPCKYCGKLIPPNSTVCPLCGKVNPLGPFRCPKCHEPIEKDWKVCPKCNQDLRIACPYCGKITFFGDYCEDCGARLLVKCPYCGQEQPPISDNCLKCGKLLQRSKK